VITEKIHDRGFYDWDLMVSLIAQQRPQFQPGTRHGYQATTFGWLVGEVVQRISGKSLGTFFRDEIAKPLKADFLIGMPESQERDCAIMVSPDPAEANLAHPFFLNAMKEGSVQWHMLGNSGRHMAPNEDGPAQFDSVVAHGSEIGAAGGITNGRGLAKMYSLIANRGVIKGHAYISEDSLARMSTVVSAGSRDFSLLRPSRFSLGFMKSQDNRRESNSEGESMILTETAVAHPGYGGSIGFADPEIGLSFGYTMNRMGQGTGLNIRGQSLVDATYQSLGYRSNLSGAWLK